MDSQELNLFLPFAGQKNQDTKMANMCFAVLVIACQIRLERARALTTPYLLHNVTSPDVTNASAMSDEPITSNKNDVDFTNETRTDSISFKHVTSTMFDETQTTVRNTVSNDTDLGEAGGLRYSSASDLWLKIVYLVIGSIGIFGNFLTTFVMLYYKSLRTKLTNTFIVNQSIIDFFAAMVMVLSQFTDNITWVPEGLPAHYFCKLWLSKTLLWGAFTTSTFNLVIMTLERYFAIVHTFTYTKLFTRSKAKVGMVLVWFIGQGWGSYCLFSTAIVDGECIAFSVWPSPEFARSFGIVIVAVQYFIPITILILAYGQIILTLHRKATEGISDAKDKTENGNRKSSVNVDPREAKMRRARQNVIKTLIIVGVCFIVCWGPNQFLYLFSNIGIAVDFTSIYYHWTVMMTSLNCCINPIIYTCKYEQFKKCLKRLFHISQPTDVKDSTGDSNAVNMTDVTKF